MKLILASASPRRRELMEMLCPGKLEIVPAVGEECADPVATVCATCQAKALAVAKAFPLWEKRPEGAEEGPAADPAALVVSSDTIVVLDGQIMGKPHSPEEAEQMLSSLSGRTHQVYTAVTLHSHARQKTEVACTQVTFRPLDPTEIRAYIASGEPMDKAGAYGIQGRGAVLVSHLEGDYFNVMGLPLCTLCRMLRSFGVKVLGV